MTTDHKKRVARTYQAPVAIGLNSAAGVGLNGVAGVVQNCQNGSSNASLCYDGAAATSGDGCQVGNAAWPAACQAGADGVTGGPI